MFKIINWICYICVNFLVLEVMVFLCKDVIKMSKSNKKGKTKSVGNSTFKVNEHIYTNKIAK